MARNSNDDRSDSMNPNNDAYWASEANRSNQLGEHDDDDFSCQGQYYSASIRHAGPVRELATYAIAMLAFDGTSLFVCFNAVSEDTRSIFACQIRHIVSSVQEAAFDFMVHEAKGSIAYSRIWGPGAHDLQWYDPGMNKEWWDAPERMSGRNLTQVHNARAWFGGLRDRANQFEHNLEMLDHKEAKELGNLTGRIDLNTFRILLAS